MNTLKRRIWLITTIFGLLAIAAAACSSSEEPTETPATAVPPTETSPTATASSSGTNQLAVATATIIASGEAPDPDSPEGTLVFAWNAVAQAAGVNQYGVAEIIVGWECPNNSSVSLQQTLKKVGLLNRSRLNPTDLR